jgi:hypothetical protein
MARKDIHTLKELMAVKRGILLPGVPNALAARAVVDVGFEAIYLTGRWSRQHAFGTTRSGVCRSQPARRPHNGDPRCRRPADYR